MLTRREIQEKLEAVRLRMFRQMCVNWTEKKLGVEFGGEAQIGECVVFVAAQIDNGNLVMHTSNDGDDLGLRLEITEKGKREIELFSATMN